MATRVVLQSHFGAFTSLERSAGETLVKKFMLDIQKDRLYNIDSEIDVLRNSITRDDLLSLEFMLVTNSLAALPYEIDIGRIKAWDQPVFYDGKTPISDVFPHEKQIAIKSALMILHHDGIINNLISSKKYRGLVCDAIYKWFPSTRAITKSSTAYDRDSDWWRTEFLKLAHLCHVPDLSEFRGSGYKNIFFGGVTSDVLKGRVYARFKRPYFRGFENCEVWVLLKDFLFKGESKYISLEIVKECVEEIMANDSPDPTLRGPIRDFNTIIQEYLAGIEKIREKYPAGIQEMRFK